MDDKFVEKEVYNHSYLQWKSWDQTHFGMLSKNQMAYFDCELKRMQKIITSKDKLLEIGFGNGSFLSYSKIKQWDCMGSEVNKGLVDVAKKSDCNVVYAENLKAFSDSSFDVIVAFDVLEHIAQDELPEWFFHIKRVLKDDGVFLARFPNGDSPIGLASQNGDITHLTSLGTGKVSYLTALHDMKLIFLVGQAQPLSGIRLPQFFYRLLALPLRWLINKFIKLVFFPNTNIDYCSSNLVMICKKHD